MNNITKNQQDFLFRLLNSKFRAKAPNSEIVSIAKSWDADWLELVNWYVDQLDLRLQAVRLNAEIRAAQLPRRLGGGDAA